MLQITPSGEPGRAWSVAREYVGRGSDFSALSQTDGEYSRSWQNRGLIPVEVEGMSTPPLSLPKIVDSGFPPSYDGGMARQSSATQSPNAMISAQQ